LLSGRSYSATQISPLCHKEQETNPFLFVHHVMGRSSLFQGPLHNHKTRFVATESGITDRSVWHYEMPREKLTYQGLQFPLTFFWRLPSSSSEILIGMQYRGRGHRFRFQLHTRLGVTSVTQPVERFRRCETAPKQWPGDAGDISK
jgi:hypothetical protein